MKINFFALLAILPIICGCASKQIPFNESFENAEDTINNGEWGVQIKISAIPLPEGRPKYNDHENFFGVKEGAAEYFEGDFDIPNPPNFPNNSCEGYFFRTKVQPNPWNLAYDFVGQNDKKTWLFVIESNREYQVTLKFIGSPWPKSGKLILIDHKISQQEITDSMEYEFISARGSRYFQIEYR